MGLFGGGDRKRLGAGNGEKASSSGDAKRSNFVVAGHKVTAECKLAEGGFAIVYRVADSRGRRMALKRQFIRDDHRHLEACQREADILRAFTGHKNIVHYIGASIQQQADGVYEYMLLTLYYPHSILELMNDRLVRGENLNGGEVVRIMCDMCQAVAALHHARTPIIHRDLKVENILVDGSNPPTFVLCDFGSATTNVLNASVQGYAIVQEDIEKYTTLSYRAPEMVDLYSNIPIGTKADIWAQLNRHLTQNVPAPNWQKLLSHEESLKASPSNMSNGRTPTGSSSQNRPSIKKTTVAPRLRPKGTMPVGAPLSTPTEVFEATRRLPDQVQSARADDPKKVLGFTDLPDAPLESSAEASPVTDLGRPVVQHVSADRQQTSQQHLQSQARGHRRNQSDTTGVALSTAAHSAYWTQADATSSASHYQFETIAAASDAPQAPTIVTTSDDCNASLDLDSWNPFAGAPYGSENQTVQNRPVDDINFGAQFDMLPRPKRMGSVSSTSNVKSSESLVMDERDPFGQAPFNPLPPATRAAQPPSASAAHSERSSQATLKDSPPAAGPVHSAAVAVTVQCSSEQSPRDAGGQSPPVSNVLAKRYTKLVEHDDSGLAGANNSNTLELLATRHSDEADSVGSATDLKQRMGGSDTHLSDLGVNPIDVDSTSSAPRAATSSGSESDLRAGGDASPLRHSAAWLQPVDDDGADRLIGSVGDEEEEAPLPPPPVPPHKDIPLPKFPVEAAHNVPQLQQQQSAVWVQSQIAVVKTSCNVVENAAAAAHTLPRATFNTGQNNVQTSLPVAPRTASGPLTEQPIRLVVNNSPAGSRPASSQHRLPTAPVNHDCSQRPASGSSSDDDVRSFSSHSKSMGGGATGPAWAKRTKESKRSHKSLKHYYDELDADEHMLVAGGGSGIKSVPNVCAPPAPLASMNNAEKSKHKAKRSSALLGSASFVNNSFMDEDTDAACRF